MSYNDSNQSRVQIDEYLKGQRKKTNYERMEELEAHYLGMQEQLKDFNDKFGELLKMEMTDTLFNRLKNKWRSLDLLRNLRRNMGSQPIK